MGKHIKLLSTVGATALTIALVLSGCGKSGSKSSSTGGKQTQTLEWTANASITTLDPAKAADTTSQQLLYNSNQGLLVLSGQNQVSPGIAKSYQVSKDGKTYTFDLRKSKWSNGKPLTAQDFVYGFQRSANPKTASQMAYYMGNIKNYTAVSTGKAAPSKLGVEAKGDYKFIVHLDTPQTYFKQLVTMPVFYAQNKAAVVKYGAKYGTNSSDIVSNGPFTVTNWTGTNDKWSLKKNPYYWNAKDTKLNLINYTVIKDPQTGLNQYQAGKLDQLQLSGKDQVQNYKNSADLHNRTTLSTKFLLINEKTVPAAKNIKIRQAISYAIDRNQLTHDVLGNGSTPTKGFVPKEMAAKDGTDFADAAYVPGTDSYNLAKAKQLWKEGLKETGKQKVNVNLLGDDDATSKSVTEFLQSQLEKLPGLKVTNESLPHGTVVSKTLGKQYDISLFGWSPSLSDPISSLQTKVTGNSINASDFSNAKFDQLVDWSKNRDANNPDKRWDDLVNAEKILMQQQGVITLYQASIPELIKSKVKDVQYFPNGPTWDFSKAYIQK